MYFLFKGGMVGTMFVLLGLGGIFARGYITVDKLSDMRDRFFLRAMLAAYAGQLLASLAMPRLTYPEGHVFVAMMAAVFFAMAQGQESEAGLGSRGSGLEEAVSSRRLPTET
ncbi:MAG: hypothetical protein IT368_09335, partial [Candidatus Hydrogenedentes bacterium]|nr:hypothetical protein [Candidatus Hydrogenedentota bacterium]